MPFDIETCETSRLLIVRLVGRIEAETLRAAFDAIETVAREECLRSLLVDGRETTMLEAGPGRTALLAEPWIDRTVVKLLLLQAAEGARERKLFEREEDALAWLFMNRPARLLAAASLTLGAAP